MSRTVPLLLALAFLLPATLPLVGGSTGPTFTGDVVINGAFRDGTPAGHPAKPNNATSNFVAFDWVGGATADGETTGDWTLVEDGLRLTKTAGPGDVNVQQYFNGSFAFSHKMELFGVSVTAYAAQPNTHLSLNLRYRDAAGANLQGSKALVLGTTPQTFTFEAADLGVPSGVQELVSVRLMLSQTGVPVTLQRVSVYATNGIEARNLHVLPGGDDVLVPGGEAAFLSPGADGKYTFLVGMAADNGDLLPSLDAWACLYTAEQVLADRGYPDNTPQLCQGAFLPSGSPSITRTREGDAFRFDVDASAVRPPSGFSGAVALYAAVEVDGSYDDANPSATRAWKTGYFSLARLAADAAGAGVSNEFPIPTPIFVDGDADGIPDAVQTDELDHFAAIVTPLHGTATPAATVVTPTFSNEYELLVEVYQYPDARAAAGGAPPTGAPLALDARGIGFGLFDATLLTSGGQPDLADDALWLAGHEDFSQVSETQYLVRVPVDAVPGNRVVGAWAFYDVDGENTRRTAAEPAFGPSDTAFDFYSSVQTAAKTFAFADGLRSHFTPLLLEPGSYTGDATLVLRKAGDDDVTLVDGTLVVAAGPDGAVSFEYAMVLSDGRTSAGTAHGFALYDAAGLASDGFAPGTSGLAHAEWTGQGVLDDGWYRIDVPASAFSNAKGPVGAWAYVDDDASGTLVSRSGWYNLLKPAAALLSPTAAERALYPPTPILLVDAATGLPADLAAALQALPGLASVMNPLVNPGFEADLLVEGAKDTNDAYGATMTSPPWFFRLDDKGTGQPTNPVSTHEVVNGAGRHGGDALGIRYSTRDAGKGLMLGQLLGVEHAQAAFAWEDATGVAFDVKSASDLRFDVDLHYLASDGSVKTSRLVAHVAGASGWTRVEQAFRAPVDGRLLGLYVLPNALGDAYFLLDNVAIKGSRTVLGDARTDLMDGFAVVIEPAGLSGANVRRVGGAASQYYLFDVSLVSYVEGGATQVDLADVDGLSFGLRTDALAKDVGSILRLRARTDVVTAVVPAGEAPATPAAPWAFVEAGSPYFPLGNPAYAMQPASGYYSPIKNALRGSLLADRLDYAGTPVNFTTAQALDLGADQQMQLVGTPETGYRVLVKASTPFVETTTLTVSSPSTTRSFEVVLDSDLGTEVAGLSVTHAELPTLTFRTTDTLFSRGALVVAGEPVAAIEACRVDQLPACATTGLLTGQAVRFTDRTVVPGAEPYARSWDFGDGSAPASAATVDHVFTTPGARTVTLSVVTASGKESEATYGLEVANRAPVALGLDVSPAAIRVDSVVRAQARASDPDGGTLSYQWSVEGVEVEGAPGRTLVLTPEVLLATTGAATLARGTYDIAYLVRDGQGGETAFATTFTVVDGATTSGVASVEVAGFPEAAYALVGETVRVKATAADVDDAITGVVAKMTLGATVVSAPMTLEEGLWSADLAPAEPGVYAVSVVATSEGGSVESAAVPFEVLADAAPVAVLDGPTLLQALETGVFDAAGSADPDARGGLAYAWLVDGVEVANGPAFSFEAIPATVGRHEITLRVQDATGQVGTASAFLDVDDILVVTAQVVAPPMGPATVTVLVVDEAGRPVPGAHVEMRDFSSLVAIALGATTVQTDENGVATWEIKTLGPLALPGEHRLEIHVEAASHEGAPVDDFETVDQTVVYSPALLA